VWSVILYILYEILDPKNIYIAIPHYESSYLTLLLKVSRGKPA
jgi:hypothetical protein